MVARTSFENLQVYRLGEKLADEVWTLVTAWEHFAKTTVGRQMVRAADSVGANIAEGSGRGSFQDNRRFVKMARGSLNETKHWLRRAYRRSLLSAEDVKRIRPIIDELAPKLNAYLQSIGSMPDTIHTNQNGDRATDNGPRTVLLDSHAHLDDTDFDLDRAAVIERARDAGLRYILVAGGGTGPDRLDSPLAIAESHDWIYASVGIHPHEARHFTDSHAEKILQLAQHPKVVAVGEIGLDYYYDHSPRDVQKQVLIRQMELACELKQPIIIHCRDAWADLREIAASHWKSAGLGGILHCFTGSPEDARAFLDSGFLISFAGNLTFKKAENLREVARLIPLDRLLTETDSPYLAPVPYRGKRNEPAYVRGVTQELARLHNLNEEELARQVLENFQKFLI